MCIRKAFLLFIMGSLFSSCISTKKLTYLQENETAKKEIYQPNKFKYRLQPNDLLNISVRSFDQAISAIFDEKALNTNVDELISFPGGYRVNSDGNIEMLLLGKLNVIGKTVDEIKVLIEQKLNEYFREKSVFVSVQLAGIRFSVVGDVNQPGGYVVHQNQVNIFEAIAQAGDVTMTGNRKEIQIIRQNPTGLKVVELDLTNRNILTSPYYFIYPNDVINVNPRPIKSYGVGSEGFETFTFIVGVLTSAVFIFAFSLF